MGVIKLKIWGKQQRQNSLHVRESYTKIQQSFCKEVTDFLRTAQVSSLSWCVTSTVHPTGMSITVLNSLNSIHFHIFTITVP